jgi:hypothetical protein
MLKVIYYGIPCLLCDAYNRSSARECSVLVAPWWADWFIADLPFNGEFMVYEGSYWSALWHWLTAQEDAS